MIHLLKKKKNLMNLFKSYIKKNSLIISIFYGLQEDKYICNNKNFKYTNYSFQGISVLNLSIMTFNIIISLPKFLIINLKRIGKIIL